MKPSSLLTDVRVVLAMLRHDVPGSALAKAAHAELTKACSRFLGGRHGANVGALCTGGPSA
jgi:hypothetical protein